MSSRFYCVAVTPARSGSAGVPHDDCLDARRPRLPHELLRYSCILLYSRLTSINLSVLVRQFTLSAEGEEYSGLCGEIVNVPRERIHLARETCLCVFIFLVND